VYEQDRGSMGEGKAEASEMARTPRSKEDLINMVFVLLLVSWEMMVFDQSLDQVCLRITIGGSEE
jgi:hypothetical protein